MRYLVTILVVVSFVVVLPAAAAKHPRVEGDRLEFRFPDLEGNEVSLSDDRFAGKVVLVDLWGTWCPPCVSEIPTLVEIQERYRDRGLIIVAIAFEGDDDAESRRDYLGGFVEDNGINYLVLDAGPPRDFDAVLPELKNVRGLPIEIFIDRSGAVVETRNSYGYKKSWVKKLTRDLEALLAED